MNSRTLLVLLAAALAAIVAAAVLSQRNAPRQGDASGDRLLPALGEQINDVRRVSLERDGDGTTLERSGRGWTVVEKSGYPADSGKLRTLLMALAEARLVEAKTSSPDRYPELGVQDAGAGSDSLSLQLEGPADEVRLLIGKPPAHGTGTYVRRAGQAQSWLVSSPLEPSARPDDWLDKELADIASIRIAHIEIVRPDGARIEATRAHAGDPDLALADIPPGRTAARFEVNDLASALAGLRFEDVRPAAGTAVPDHPLEARFTLFDGTRITLEAWDEEGRTWARLAVDAGPPPGTGNDTGPADGDTTETDTDAGPGEPPAADAAAAEADSSGPDEPDPATVAARAAELETLRRRFDGWVFALPSYKFSALDKEPEQLLESLAVEGG